MQCQAKCNKIPDYIYTVAIDVNLQLKALKKINFYRIGKSATKESHTVNFTLTSKPNNFNWQRKSCIVYILLTLYPISSD